MKILHILTDLYTGGAQKLSIDICNELAKDKNNEVTICSLEKLNEQQQIMYEQIDKNVNFISLDKVGKNPIIIFKILKLLLSLKPDVVHTHTRAQMFSALGLILTNTPNIHTIHSVAHKETTPLRLKFYKILYKFFNFTPVSISNLVLDSAKKFYGNEYDIKINNGTKKGTKSPYYNETKKFIDSLKKDKNTKIFVSIGRFYEVKNQELLIDAFEELLKDNVDAHLLIIASEDVVPAYAKKCKSKIKTKSNIHLLGEKSNIFDYLMLSDALCFTSTYEGLPMAIIEGLSVGTPTIATPVGGIPDIVKDGITGYLSKDMSTLEYKKLFDKIIYEKELDKKTILWNHKQHYSIESCTQQYLKLYQSKIDKTRLNKYNPKKRLATTQELSANFKDKDTDSRIASCSKI